MRYARMAVRGTAGVVGSLALAGCVSLSGTPSLPIQPRPVKRFQPAPDLRIAPDTLAAAPEIPLVPLPIPPNSPRQAPASQVTPPSAEQPARPGRVNFVAIPTNAGVAVGTGTSNTSAPKIATTTTAGPAPVIGSPLRRLYQQAVARYATMNCYIVRLTRRERVRGKDKPEEVILFKFRKDPWSLHFRWLDGEGRGREVVYVKDRYENKLHTLLAAGDIPLTPAGKRLALPVDSMMVRNASRHPITEAGIGASIDRIGMLIDAAERGDRRRGTLNDLGPQARPEFPLPAHIVEHVIPPGVEADLPNGGKRTYCFDPETGLPMLVQARDDKGKEVEYYLYSRLMPSVNLDDDDFNPDRLWNSPTASARAPRR